MVASILRLRLAGLANAIRRPRSGAAIAAVLIAVALVVLALVGLVALVETLAPAAPELRRLGLVAVGSAILLGFWLLPLLFGVDDGLDPRAFARFGLGPRRIAAALAVSGLATVPAVLLLVFAVVQAGLWADAGAGPVLTALLGGLLAIVIAVLGARVAAALAGRLLHGFVARNVVGLLALAVLALAATGLAAMVVVDWPAVGVTELRRWGVVLSWTPWGAPWSAAGDLVEGEGGRAALRLLVVLATVGALWAAWELIVRRSLSTRESGDAVRERGRGIGVFAALPATPAGAVAARSIVYWVRDPRYSVPPLMIPLIPLVLVPAFLLSGISAEITVWLPVPLMCLVLGWLVHNDVAQDGTAFWLHVVSGVSGRADRWGRLVVPLLIGLPLAVGGAAASAAIADDWSVAIPLASLSLCALLCGMGVASAASARAPYPSVAPGDSPFALPQQLGDDHAGHQGSLLLLAALACLPTAALIAWSLLVDPGLMPWAAVSGVVVGVGVLLLGVELGARVVSRAGPELLAFARSN